MEEAPDAAADYFLALEFLGGWLVDAFKEILTLGMTVDLRTHPLGPDGQIDFVQEVTRITGVVLPPFVALVSIFVAATLLAGYSQIGIKIARKALGIKFKKLNPVTNIGKIFQISALFKTVFSAFKLIVIGSILYLVLRQEWSTILTMHQAPEFKESVAYIMMLALRVFFWISMIVLVLAIADIAWSRFKHTKELMMTKQEVEDERKRTDGDPMIKGRLRSARMALMKQRMMDAIPNADVVITNPTHFSVALKYDRQKNMAPEVVAKGLDDIAMRIRELATQNNVPLMEDPPLARALYRAVDIGQEIPERFFKAVATVLGHIFKMKEGVA